MDGPRFLSPVLVLKKVGEVDACSPSISCTIIQKEEKDDEAKRSLHAHLFSLNIRDVSCMCAYRDFIYGKNGWLV